MAINHNFYILKKKCAYKTHFYVGIDKLLFFSLFTIFTLFSFYSTIYSALVSFIILLLYDITIKRLRTTPKHIN